MTINSKRLTLINNVMNLLEDTDELTDDAEMGIDVKLVSYNTYVRVYFEHEHGEWTFRVEVD